MAQISVIDSSQKLGLIMTIGAPILVNGVRATVTRILGSWSCRVHSPNLLQRAHRNANKAN